ncbi:WWOX-like protein [Mya arenaria]|uniref:WWOX-like protein n=1 Tax=Mya arenaria TaxID=6604 RepID=A0ABY7ERP2_MYAAR|nr:WWOX-like protein [Mya arenaria]
MADGSLDTDSEDEIPAGWEERMTLDGDNYHMAGKGSLKMMELSSMWSFETARSLAFHGAHVVMACRNTMSAQTCRDLILAERPGVKVTVMKIDLASLNSVKEFADQYKQQEWPLHYLICNAAVFGLPYTQTEDGLEATFQVNHLAHFYLTKLLWTQLMTSAPARVIVVSSESHRSADLNILNLSEEKLSPLESGYWDLRAYNLSKLCNLLFSLHLNTLLCRYRVSSVALHPGNMMYTNLQRHWWLYRTIFYFVRPWTKSMQQGAATTVYCAIAPEMQAVGGMYFNNCCRCPPSSAGADDELAKALWDIIMDCLYL